MNIADKILKQIDARRNPTVLGLDPRFEQIPDFITQPLIEKHGRTLKAVALSYLEFNKRVLKLLKDVAGLVKPQSAFYEQVGLEGVSALAETLKFAQASGYITILDVKRNDIGTTAEAYSKAFLSPQAISGIQESAMPADAITVTPYLGSDGIAPFVADCKANGRGIFILVKTSNKSSGEFQDQVVGGKKLYELVAEKVHAWGQPLVGERGYSAVGAVVGATYPEEQEKLRTLMPKTLFLVPGYGAQGGTSESVKQSFNKDGYGALISASRSLTFPFKETSISEAKFDKTILSAAEAMAEDLRHMMKKNGISPW